MQETWTQVDRYFGDLLLPSDPALEAALAANHDADLPAIDVTPLLGQFLALIVRISGARRILEIGTLGGYSTIWLARALTLDGRLITLELEPRHARIARANLQRAGVFDRVDLRIGRASDLLRELVNSSAPRFDLIFIDADKASYPEYLQLSLELSHPGTIIIADNVVREGKVVDRDSDDPNVQGVRRFIELVAAEPRLSATVLQTVSQKKHDGFAMAVVLR